MIHPNANYRGVKFSSTGRLRPVLAALLLAASGPAAAQSFNQFVGFGDSTIDSGSYRILASPGGGATFDSLWASGVAAGAGKPTTSPGLMSSEVLAGLFGLTAIPADQGGSNYATSGAKNVTINTTATGGFQAAISTVTQIADYLAATGGHANGNAIYLISSGGNDVAYALGQSGTGPFPSNPTTYVTSAAGSLANAVASLQAAGARYFVVPDLAFSFPTGGGAGNAAERQERLIYSRTLWSDLAANGVNFIPADYNAVRLAIAASPASFGFQFIDTTNVACTQPAGVTTAWALLCSSNPAAPSHLVSPNAEQIYLFADDQHLTTAGQKIVGDYEYSLIVAPSEISFLAETAIQTTFQTIIGIQEQIDLTQRLRPPGWSVWINGELSYLKLDNSFTGFPNDPGFPLSGTMGVDYKWQSDWLAGAALTAGDVNPTFSLGGGYTQETGSLSLYTAYRHFDWWGDLIGTAAWLGYDTNRTVPIGITMQPNNGTTNGYDLSLAGEVGYDFHYGRLTHGPVAGFILQQVGVDGFTESGSFTSLSFGDQIRNSEVSALGYQARFDWGMWHPFAQVVWDHEFDPLNRLVTASLTTIAAPSYSLPAVVLGRDWATTTVGMQLTLTAAWSGLASFTAQLGQDHASNYGGLIGLNYTLGQAPPSPIVYKN